MGACVLFHTNRLVIWYFIREISPKGAFYIILHQHTYGDILSEKYPLSLVRICVKNLDTRRWKLIGFFSRKCGLLGPYNQIGDKVFACRAPMIWMTPCQRFCSLVRIACALFIFYIWLTDTAQRQENTSQEIEKKIHFLGRHFSCTVSCLLF